ncbi:hypothetical protein [Nocardia jiangxiensis]|uniref:hypothetical protein n=1 Tax=Nocardia jiangxiensis TaxID=282685 RepID=UPI0002E952C3|nr:hypothetical protein [Nocardia jiangxiensis]
MTIKFSDFDYDARDGDYVLVVDNDTLAKLTDRDVNQASGLFGGGEIGTVRISRDGEASLENNLSDVAGEGGAVGPTDQAGYRWRIPVREDDSDPKVTKILEARKRLQGDYEDTDSEGDYGFRILARYAALLGRRYEIDQLQCYNDFASVWTITPAYREKNATIQEYKEIFEGNVFNIDVELKSPIAGKEFSESVGGCIGKTQAVEVARELATDAVSGIQKQVQEARNG